MAPLHPHRVQEALKTLERCLQRESPLYQDEIAAYETATAALRLVGKAQKAAGITGNVADMGAALLSFMRAAGK